MHELLLKGLIIGFAIAAPVGPIGILCIQRSLHAVSHIVLLATAPNSSMDAFTAADRYFAESVCPERKALYETNMKHLKSDIEANPDIRFILYSLRSGPRTRFINSGNASRKRFSLHYTR